MIRTVVTDPPLISPELTNWPELDSLLTRLVREEALAEFDLHWVTLLARLDPAASPVLLLTAALARFAIDQGHICLDFDETATWWPPLATAAGYPKPDTPALARELRRSPLVDISPSPQLSLPSVSEVNRAPAPPHLPPEQTSKIKPTSEKTDLTRPVFADPFVAPLVLANHRLYLHRYWQYERTLVTDIRRRAVLVQPQPDLIWAEQRLRKLATATGVELDRDQQRAVLAALRHHLTVITGGPGTGKTTIIFFILTILAQEPSRFHVKPTAVLGDEVAVPKCAVAAPGSKVATSGSAIAVLSGDAASSERDVAVPENHEIAASGHDVVASGGNPPRILLLAPTGKAALRLGEAISQKQDSLVAALPDLADKGRRLAGVPAPMTIHRALGYQSDNPTVFRYNRDRPLAADLVVVDEASMVDLALMSKLLAAIPPKARLILLGDQDQLASVEAGAILGDICRASSGLASCVVSLQRGFRFDPQRGIGALVRRIKAGASASALAVPARGLNLGAGDEQHPGLELSSAWRRTLPIKSERWPELTLNVAPDPENDPEFRALILAGFRGYLEASSAAEALSRLNDFRLLCPHRRGPAGVERLNVFCRELLMIAELIPGWSPALGPNEWYRGRPLLVVANNYDIRLFNGDLGVIWDSPEDNGELMAFFPAAAGLRRLSLGRLPRHETAFAMTIHKSQGSEFFRVAVVLPREDSPLLSRELLYTAVSRARGSVHLFGPEAVISKAVERRRQRSSGLAEQLGSVLAE